jgi:hypothetical protein
LIVCYAVYQPLYSEWTDAAPRTIFLKGLPKEAELRDGSLLRKDRVNLMVIDDLGEFFLFIFFFFFDPYFLQTIGKTNAKPFTDCLRLTVIIIPAPFYTVSTSEGGGSSREG